MTGIVRSLRGAFPLAALVARCYRFPIPFAGSMGGPLAVPGSPFAVVSSGLAGVVVGIPRGGSLVLAVLGAAAGTAARLLAGQDARREHWPTLAFALAGDLVAVMIRAVLDTMIGPWSPG